MEINLAVLVGDRPKSPCGFFMVFYQENWGLIKEELVKVFHEFFKRGVLNSSMFETFVCLIPKENVVKVKHFRPAH